MIQARPKSKVASDSSHGSSDTEKPVYPLLFHPVYKNYVWGGSRIPVKYGRNVPTGTCAESWEISGRTEGMSVIRNGRLAGKSLSDALDLLGRDLSGTSVPAKPFPLLIKLIDSGQCLSVQVHPDNISAAGTGGEPKTEMWYVLHAEPGARVFCGLRRGIDRGAFMSALGSGRLRDVLESVPVVPGDAVYVPGGRVHAVDAGCLLLEVQQSSNTTYRVYDWGRTDHDGKPRELHIDQALKVINWNDTEPAKVAPEPEQRAGNNTIQTIVRSPFFVFQRIRLSDEFKAGNDGKSFHAIFVPDSPVDLSGAGVTVRLDAGTSCLLPAALKTYTLKPAGKNACVLRTSVILPGR